MLSVFSEEVSLEGGVDGELPVSDSAVGGGHQHELGELLVKDVAVLGGVDQVERNPVHAWTMYVCCSIGNTNKSSKGRNEGRRTQMGTTFFANGVKIFFSCVHGSKRALGEVMFLAALDWVKGRGRGEFF